MRRAAIWIVILSLAAGSLPAQEMRGGDESMLGRPRKESPGSKTIQKFRYPEIEWKIPKVGDEVRRTVWPEGTVVYVMEDHTLPIVNVRAQLHVGSAWEPEELAGLASLTGALMRDGGTSSWTPEEVERTIEYNAARISSSIDGDEGSVSLNCTTEVFDEILPLWAEILTVPRFDEKRLDLQKSQIRESLRRRPDNPGSLVSYIHGKEIYQGFPTGRPQEWESISRITRDDLLEFHKRYFAPNNAMIAIVGDVTPKTVEQVRQALSGWERREVSFPEVPPVPSRRTKGTVQFIARDINQSNIRMGHLGTTWDDPDRYALQVMNFILGGGSFTSRLTEKVRSDEGLAYSVGSSFSMGPRLGSFSARCETRADATGYTITLMRDVIEGMRAAPPSEAELKRAKDAYINRYVFQFTDADSVVARLMDLEFYDRPRDMLETYLDRIRAVTAADVQRVARKHLHPDRMVVSVVGKPESFDRPLADLGWGAALELPVPELPEEAKPARAAGGTGKR